MRVSSTGLVLCLAAAPGCVSECEGGEAVRAKAFSVDTNFLSIRGDEAPAFVVEGSPANGTHVWEMDWASELGPVDVYIDCQVFDGTGEWDDMECSRFNMSFGGTYEDEIGAKHAFTARGSFLFYAGQLEGRFEYAESWSVDGETGVLRGDIQARGQRVGS